MADPTPEELAAAIATIHAFEEAALKAAHVVATPAEPVVAADAVATAPAVEPVVAAAPAETPVPSTASVAPAAAPAVPVSAFVGKRIRVLGEVLAGYEGIALGQSAEAERLADAALLDLLTRELAK
jgi:hypothetical protein